MRRTKNLKIPLIENGQDNWATLYWEAMEKIDEFSKSASDDTGIPEAPIGGLYGRSAGGWVELTTGVPAYATAITTGSWVPDGTRFKIIIPSDIHNQGAYRYLSTTVLLEGEQVLSEVLISSTGVVTVYSDAPFDGSILIRGLG